MLATALFRSMMEAPTREYQDQRGQQLRMKDHKRLIQLLIKDFNQKVTRIKLPPPTPDQKETTTTYSHPRSSPSLVNSFS